MKYCIECEHFLHHTAERGYSEWTPGEYFRQRCARGHWELDTHEDEFVTWEGYLKQAQTCKDFKPRRK